EEGGEGKARSVGGKQLEHIISIVLQNKIKKELEYPSESSIIFLEIVISSEWAPQKCKETAFEAMKNPKVVKGSGLSESEVEAKHSECAEILENAGRAVTEDESSPHDLRTLVGHPKLGMWISLEPPKEEGKELCPGPTVERPNPEKKSIGPAPRTPFRNEPLRTVSAEKLAIKRARLAERRIPEYPEGMLPGGIDGPCGFRTPRGMILYINGLVRAGNIGGVIETADSKAFSKEATDYAR
ncbi:MAG: hypothetical protein GY816_11150, partial [Cytophagales bacterium]|nr:hypothetical protein [Cytophagales bacterium]